MAYEKIFQNLLGKFEIFAVHLVVVQTSPAQHLTLTPSPEEHFIDLQLIRDLR